MRVIGYVRGADQADQRRRVEGGAAFRCVELAELVVEDVARLRDLVAAGDVAAVFVASLKRLPADWLADDDLLEHLDRHGVALVAGAEGIDTGTAAGRLALAETRTDHARAIVEAWAEARRTLDSPLSG